MKRRPRNVTDALDRLEYDAYFFCMLFLKRGDLEHLLDGLESDYELFVPVRRPGGLAFTRYPAEGEKMVIGDVRAFEPVKAFFLRGREQVASGFSPDPPEGFGSPPCLVGVKSCDLKGFVILDSVFMDEESGDPTYIRARREGLIISSDCTGAIETCFCTAVGVKPWPEEGFDLNLSPVEGGYVVEVGSDKGRRVTEAHSSLFTEAGEERIKARQNLRGTVKRQVEKNAADIGMPPPEGLSGLVGPRYDDADLWRDEASTCVECGACNTICPTCHCFFLYDQLVDGESGRFRVWDSCLLKDFARVAGGENPRDHLWMRLRNRFDKKFDFFPAVEDAVACTGCGRCIAACPAEIDIRKVLARLAGA